MSELVRTGGAIPAERSLSELELSIEEGRRAGFEAFVAIGTALSEYPGIAALPR